MDNKQQNNNTEQSNSAQAKNKPGKGRDTRRHGGTSATFDNIRFEYKPSGYPDPSVFERQVALFATKVGQLYAGWDRFFTHGVKPSLEKPVIPRTPKKNAKKKNSTPAAPQNQQPADQELVDEHSEHGEGEVAAEGQEQDPYDDDEHSDEDSDQSIPDDDESDTEDDDDDEYFYEAETDDEGGFTAADFAGIDSEAVQKYREQIFQASLRAYVDRRLRLRDEKMKIFNLLLEHCGKSLLNRLKTKESWFRKVTGEHNLTALWNKIKVLCQRGDADLGGANGILNHRDTIERDRALRSIAQRPDEYVHEYQNRFMALVRSLLDDGYEKKDLIPAKFTKGITDQRQIDKIVNRHLVIYFIEGLETRRFKEMKETLNRDLKAGNTKSYPKTVDMAAQRAYTYPLANSVNRSGSGGRRREERIPDNQTSRPGVAFATSGQQQRGGTKEKAEPAGGQARAAAEETTAEGERKNRKGPKCYFCGEFGHIEKRCPMKSGAKQNLENEQRRQTGSTTYVTVGEGVAFPVTNEPGVVLPVRDESERVVIPDKDEIVLDSAASISVFMNANLLTDIRDEPSKAMKISGVNTDAEPVVSMAIGKFGEFEPVYYCPKAAVNIWSMSALAQHVGYAVEYSSSDNTFVVKELATRRVYTFIHRHGLYRYDTRATPDFDESMNYALITTLSDNMSKLTPRERKEVEVAADLDAKLGYPSLRDYLWLTGKGHIVNCPVTPKHAHNMYKVKGKSVARLKGSTTRRKPEHVPDVEETVERKVSGNLVLCMDLMFVNQIVFLLTISRRLCLLMVKYLADRQSLTLRDASTEIITSYRANSFIITGLMSDGESGIGALKSYFESLGIHVEVAPKGQHVPEAERAIRHLKEKARAVWNTLPYTPTHAMTVYLIYYCVRCINMFPKAGSVDPDQSPREMFTGKKVDYKTECLLQFGEYCQIAEEDEKTNTMKERTVGGVCVGPQGNGAYYFVSLKTWRVLTRRAWFKVPMPDEIIQLINDKSKAERATRRNKDDPSRLIIKLGSHELPDEAQEDNPDESDAVNIVEDVPIVIDDRLAAEPNVVHDEESVPSERDDGGGGDDEDVQVSDEDDDVLDDVADAGPDMEPDNIAQGDDGYIAGVVGDDIGGEVIVEDGADYLDMDVAHPAPDFVDAVAPVPFDPGGDRGGGRYSLRPRTRTSYRNFDDRFNAIFHTSGMALTNLSVRRSIKEIGQEAVTSMLKEMTQLHLKGVFEPVRWEDLTPQQRVRVLRTIMFLKRKRDNRLKSRLVAKGDEQSRVKSDGSVIKTASPTVCTETVFIIAAICAYEKRIVVAIDIEGAYLHAAITIDGDDNEEIIVELDPIIASIMSDVSPEYERYKCHSRGRRIYLRVKKALYGLIQSARLFYLHLSKTLVSFGFVVNPYDCCLFTRDFNGVQCTIVVHVDDLMVSSASREAIDAVIAELNRVYKKINVNEGPVLDYLGMMFDFSKAGEVKVSMQSMIEEMIEEMQITGVTSTPATTSLFKISESADGLHGKERDRFYSVTQKLLYLSKRARPDVLTAVSFLTTRVKSPTVEDMSKLVRCLKYLNGTKELSLRLCGSDGMTVNAYIDASFAVHPDAKGHTGATISIGKGAVFNKSTKQKLVSRSSTEAELVGLSDVLPGVLWTRNLLQAMGYSQRPAVIHQDNKSAIYLEENGRSNAGRTRHLNTRYFFVKDKIESKEVTVVHTRTEAMVADFFTKPLQGKLFRDFRSVILNTATHDERVLYATLIAPGCVAESDPRAL